MNVLIVEDEKILANEIAIFLKNENYHCDQVYSGRAASDKLSFDIYDFVLLDLGLPDFDGLKVLMEAKKNNSQASFIILSARGEIDDKIVGLNEGADDYLAKPFSLPELLSRMHAVKRRKYGVNNNLITFHGFSVDCLKRTVLFAKEEIILTKKEFDLLIYLVLNKNRVLTRIQIAEHLWGNFFEDEYESNYIDVHVKNIRKKLGRFEEATWLETIRGVGYKASL
ncbi:MAG TPA: response regulator transcription factor [Cytophagaceae bacterium]